MSTALSANELLRSKTFATDVESSCSRRRRLTINLLPLLFFELYLLGSLAAFAFVPVEELRVANPGETIAFALAGQIAIALGYCWALRRPNRGTAQLSANGVAKFTIVAATALFAAAAVWRTNGEVSLFTALSNPGVAYNAYLSELHTRTAPPVIAIARALMGPILALFLPLGVSYRNQLNARWKTLWCVGVALYLVGVLSRGTAKGLFDVVLTLPWFIAAYWFSRRSDVGPEQNRAKLLRFYFDIVLLVVIVAISLQYFALSRQSRYESKGVQPPKEMTTWISPDKAAAVSPELQFKLFMFVRYYAGGYKGLGECLSMPYEPCYGVGHSVVLSRYTAYLTGQDPDDLLAKSYPKRAEAASGYSAAYFWHTIYPWLASDITFPGAIVFIGLMGYLLGRTWIESIAGDNPFAIGFLGQLLLMFYYLPANNIRLSFSEEVISFWTLGALWLVNNRRACATTQSGDQARISSVSRPHFARVTTAQNS